MNILANDKLEIAISSKGAELKSVFQNGYEHIWQGNDKYWARSAPILFPTVGKSFNNELLINGKNYKISQHGFARDMNFEIVKRTKTQLTFQLVSTDETFSIYPYHFILQVKYLLQKNKVTCYYEVKNTGNEPIYFSIGAHPGFNLPSKNLTDYFIACDKKENVKRHLLNDGLLDGETENTTNYELVIDLDKKLFEKDAIVFKDLRSKKIKLMSKFIDMENFKIEMQFDDFPYFGIWSPKDCEEFVCLEPWCGIAGSTGSQIPFEQKEGINKILPNEIFTRKYSMKFFF